MGKNKMGKNDVKVNGVIYNTNDELYPLFNNYVKTYMVMDMENNKILDMIFINPMNNNYIELFYEYINSDYHRVRNPISVKVEFIDIQLNNLINLGMFKSHSPENQRFFFENGYLPMN